MSLGNPKESPAGSFFAEAWENSGENWDKYVTLIAERMIYGLVISSLNLAACEDVVEAGALVRSMSRNWKTLSMLEIEAKAHGVNSGRIGLGILGGSIDARQKVVDAFQTTEEIMIPVEQRIPVYPGEIKTNPCLPGQEIHDPFYHPGGPGPTGMSQQLRTYGERFGGS